jgi:hypothetical protein
VQHPPQKQPCNYHAYRNDDPSSMRYFRSAVSALLSSFQELSRRGQGRHRKNVQRQTSCQDSRSVVGVSKAPGSAYNISLLLQDASDVPNICPGFPDAHHISRISATPHTPLAIDMAMA